MFPEQNFEFVFAKRENISFNLEIMTLEEILNQEYDLEELKNGMILLVDKPKNWTSFDVIRKLQGHWKYKKIGHAGTLDPLASGLLILATGKFTKQINQIQAEEKTYIASIKLGATTLSADAEFAEENIQDTKHLDEKIVEECIQKNFLGEIEQFPPKFSAVKINGRRAYELARKGEDFEVKKRQVTVKTFEILEFKKIVENDITFCCLEVEIVCSKGTYIRSLARDLGEKLSVGGYLTDLRRTKIGEYSL